MKYFALISLYLVSLSTLACIEEPKNGDCEMSVMEVFLPEEMRRPVKNVRLEQFQYGSDQGMAALKIESDELTSLRESVNRLAGHAFLHSTQEFQILVSFTLYPDRGPTVDMRIAGVHADNLSLRNFYNKAVLLNDYRSIEDQVYIVLHYKISKDFQ